MIPDHRGLDSCRSRSRSGAIARLATLGTALCAVWLILAPPARCEEPARLSLEPSAASIAVSQEVTLTARVHEVTNLYGIDLRLGFDPQVLEVVDIDPGKEGIQSTPGRYPYPELEARNEADNDAGTIWYMVTQLGAREPVSGTGTVVTVRLRGKAAGSGAIVVNQADLASNEGFMIPADTSDATIGVTDAPVGDTGDGATAEPVTSPIGVAAAGAAVVVAAGALMMVRRRRPDHESAKGTKGAIRDTR